jgi:hypothetical protein
MEYALATLLEVAGLPFEFVPSPAIPQQPGSIWLHYGLPGDGSPGGVVIPAGDPGLWEAAEPAHVTLEGVPVLYAGETPRSLFDQQGTQVTLGFDLVQAAFWLLARLEERDRYNLDPLGRFTYAESWLARHGLAETPVVNLYAALLARALAQAARNQKVPVVRKARWPGGQRYAVMLSHDVDEVGRFGFRRGVQLLGRACSRPSPRAIVRGAYFAAVGLARSLSPGRDPYWNFKAVMDLEAGAGFRSTFFFVPEARRVDRDPPYEIDSPRIRDMLAQLHAGGWEIGVHGSFDSYLDPVILGSLRRKLEQVSGVPVRGGRQHYLRLSVPDSFRAQAGAGLTYDSTLGYHDGVGFRAGAAFPFHPFDPVTRRGVPLLELPLTIMDGPLFWQLKLTPQAATKRTLGLLDSVRQHGGLAVLLWHQRVLHEKRYPGWWQVYRLAVEHVRAEGLAWVATGRQVAGWWLAREALQLEKVDVHDGSWRWRYRAGRAVEGVTVVLGGTGRGQVSVSGAGSTIWPMEEDEVQVDLAPLAAGQPFEVMLAQEGDAP